jgi:hypothetical protein
MRNEFGEPVEGLAKIFGIQRGNVDRQPGEYRTRGRLNEIPYLDHVKFGAESHGLIGLRCSVAVTSGKIRATFASNGAPAIVQNKVGRGSAIWFSGTPAISYIKDAKFVANALSERWPVAQRKVMTEYAAAAGVAPLVRLSQPVVEAGMYEADGGTALVLANFTYQPIPSLEIEMPIRNPVSVVTSLEHGNIPFQTVAASKAWRSDGFKKAIRFRMPLGVDDLVLLKNERDQVSRSH